MDPSDPALEIKTCSGNYTNSCLLFHITFLTFVILFAIANLYIFIKLLRRICCPRDVVDAEIEANMQDLELTLKERNTYKGYTRLP